MMRAFLFRRSLLILLAAALIALAVSLVDDGAPPASASDELGTPTNLAVTVLSPTSVRVSWTRNGDPGRQFYHLQYHQHGVGRLDRRMDENSDGQNFTQTIYNLEHGATYDFRIRSFTWESTSDWSERVTVTLPDAGVLVTNVGVASYWAIQTLLGNGRTSAQPFRTGSAAGSYKMSSVEVIFHTSWTKRERDSLRAEVWSSKWAIDSWVPGSKLYDLTVPPHPINIGPIFRQGTVSFAAPDAATLEPDTLYWVVLYAPLDGRKGLRATVQPNDSSGHGWSIGNSLRESANVPPTTSSSWAYHWRANIAWFMTIKGYVFAPTADLSDLTVRPSTDGATFGRALRLSPIFDAGTTDYRVTVGNDITHVKLTPEVVDTGNATVGLKGTTTTNGMVSGPIELSVGDNTLAVRVTAENGATRDYTVTVTRQRSSNADLSALTVNTSTDGATFGGTLALNETFAAAITSYTADVTNDITHVKLTPKVSDTGKATVTVQGATVTSGMASEASELSVGDNVLTVQVTAEDGTTKDYTVTVTVTRAGSNLGGLEITGTVKRDGKTATSFPLFVTFPLFTHPWFEPTTMSYNVYVPSDLESVTFTATWVDNEVVRLILYERRDGTGSNQGAAQKDETVTSGTALTNDSNPQFPSIRVINAGRSNAGVDYFFNLQSTSLSFDGATVDDMAFTAGAEAPKRDLTLDEEVDLKLPEATGGFYNLSYTATGLPSGLSIGQDRLIRGTPEAATDSPATVTYTATDDLGSSVSLTFQVTVATPVEFDAEELEPFTHDTIEYTVGQETPLHFQFPEARGGTGTLTYHLDNRERRTPINQYAQGLTFDPVTRVLSSGTGENEPAAGQRYAVTYRAEDENGSKALAHSRIMVSGPPSLPDMANQSFTVGDAMSVTLPAATGGSASITGLRYRLEPQVPGLSFNASSRTLSGAATVTGSTAMTYTATDRNGVTDTETFTFTVTPGSSAPTSPPGSMQMAQQPGQKFFQVSWTEVMGATNYVVQVTPEGVGFQTDHGVSSWPEGYHVTVQGSLLRAAVAVPEYGNYQVRVAALNAGGAGPWAIATATVAKPPQQ